MSTMRSNQLSYTSLPFLNITSISSLCQDPIEILVHFDLSDFYLLQLQFTNSSTTNLSRFVGRNNSPQKVVGLKNETQHLQSRRVRGVLLPPE
jgi:hypothetical protein